MLDIPRLGSISENVTIVPEADKERQKSVLWEEFSRYLD
jgi:hypothetical protein